MPRARRPKRKTGAGSRSRRAGTLADRARRARNAAHNAQFAVTPTPQKDFILGGPEAAFEGDKKADGSFLSRLQNFDTIVPTLLQQDSS